MVRRINFVWNAPSKLSFRFIREHGGVGYVNSSPLPQTYPIEGQEVSPGLE